VQENCSSEAQDFVEIPEYSRLSSLVVTLSLLYKITQPSQCHNTRIYNTIPYQQCWLAE